MMQGQLLICWVSRTIKNIKYSMRYRSINRTYKSHFSGNGILPLHDMETAKNIRQKSNCVLSDNHTLTHDWSIGIIRWHHIIEITKCLSTNFAQLLVNDGYQASLTMQSSIEIQSTIVRQEAVIVVIRWLQIDLNIKAKNP